MVPTERGLWRRRHGWLSRLGPGRLHLRPLHSHRCHAGRFQENGGNKCSFFIINTCNLSLFFLFFSILWTILMKGVSVQEVLVLFEKFLVDIVAWLWSFDMVDPLLRCYLWFRYDHCHLVTHDSVFIQRLDFFFFSTDFLTLDSRNPKSAKNVSIILEVQVRYHKDICASITSLRHSSGWYYRTLSWWCCHLLSGFCRNATADPSQRVIFDDSSTNRGTNQIVKSNELLFFICWACGVFYYKPYPYCWHLFQSCWFWRRLPLGMLGTWV